MNTQVLARNKKMLAIILGVAMFATAGVSVASAQTPAVTTHTPPKITGSIVAEQLLLSSVKTNFSTAATTAAGAVPNGQVIGGMLTQKQGFLVYSFKVIDNNNMVYSVIVDPGTGSVLYTSHGHPFSMGGFGMGSAMMMNSGPQMGGQAWGSHTTPSINATSSSGSSPNPTSSQFGSSPNPSDYSSPNGSQ